MIAPNMKNWNPIISVSLFCFIICSCLVKQSNAFSPISTVTPLLTSSSRHHGALVDVTRAKSLCNHDRQRPDHRSIVFGVMNTVDDGKSRASQRNGMKLLSQVSAIEDPESITPPESAAEPVSEELVLESVSKTQLEVEETVRKAVNFVFLACSFGFAIYTILSIDSGMTRGWTQSEIAMRIPLDNWSHYENALEESPVETKTAINVIIYLLGDWLSQTAFQGKNVLDFDVKRTLRNGFIGLCFGPLVHQYYEFSDTILPVDGGWINKVQKIFMDQTLYLTVKCSIYISAVGLLSGDDWPTVKQSVEEKIGGIVITAWKFWPLVHCITYGLIPARHRILWVNCVDLIWNAILATQATKDTSKEAESSATEQELVLASATEQELVLASTGFTDSEIATPSLMTSNEQIAASEAFDLEVVADTPISKQSVVEIEEQLLNEIEQADVVLYPTNKEMNTTLVAA